MTAGDCISYVDVLGNICSVSIERMQQPSNAWLRKLPLAELQKLASGVWPRCSHCAFCGEPQHDYCPDEGLVYCNNDACMQQLVDLDVTRCLLYREQQQQQQQQGLQQPQQQQSCYQPAQQEHQREPQQQQQQQPTQLLSELHQCAASSAQGAISSSPAGSRHNRQQLRHSQEQSIKCYILKPKAARAHRPPRKKGQFLQYRYHPLTSQTALSRPRSQRRRSTAGHMDQQEQAEQADVDEAGGVPASPVSIAPDDVDSEHPDTYADPPGPSAAADTACLGRYEVKPNQPQRPARSTAEVRAAEANNWKLFHQGQPTSSLEVSLRSKSEQLQLEEGVLSCLRQHISQQARAAGCPACGVRVCDNRPDAAAQVVRKVEVLVVTFTAVISVMVPVMACNRCDTGQFNLHPFQAGCFPSSPVFAVSPLRVSGSGKTPILWFRNDLLEHLLITRQHQPRMGLGRAAAAIRQHMISKRTWDNRVSPSHFERSLSTCLHQFAVLHLSEAKSEAMGLPSEGLLCCCHVCRQGHRDFLVQQGVLENMPDTPLLRNAVDGSAGQDATNAAAKALQAALAEEASAGASTRNGIESVDASPPRGVAPGVASIFSNSATAVSATTTSTAADATAQATAGSMTPDSVAAETIVGIQGLGGSYLPVRSKSAEWQATLLKLNKNPMQAFSPYARALIIHSIYFDGLRRVAHFAKAGTSTVHDNLARLRIVPDDYVNEYINFAGRSTAVADTCNDFDADKQLGLTSRVYDISGIVGMFCRHGHVLAAVNMPVGEKWAYAICLIHILISIHNVWPYISFYDINCKFKAHFADFARLRSGWSALVVAWALAMAMPLPPFHINMHNPECIERNTSKQVVGAGRGAGEPPEIFNRYLGLSGMVLQYASKPVRELWLEVMMLAWRRMKEADLPRLLLGMYNKAVLQERICVEEQSQLVKMALGYASAEEVEQMLLPPPPIIGPSSNNITLTWRAEMAELLLSIGMLQQSHEALLLEQILPSKLLVGSTIKASVLKAKRERLAALEQQHRQQWTAHLRCATFMEGLAELCLYKVQTLQCVLGDLSRTYMFCLMLQKHIGSQRQQHRKLDKHLSKMGTKMDASIQELLAWVAQLRQNRQYLRMDDAVVTDAFAATRVSSAEGFQGLWDSMVFSISTQQQATAASSLKQMLCNGESPWASGAAVSSGVGLGPLRKRMGIVAVDIRAAGVEQQLVKHEMNSLLLSYREELQVLQGALSVVEQQVWQSSEQHESLLEQLLDSSLALDVQHDLYSSALAAQHAARMHMGRHSLLLQRQTRVMGLLAIAEGMLQPCLPLNTGDEISAPCQEQQFMAAADEVLQHGVDIHVDSDSDAEELGDLFIDEVEPVNSNVHEPGTSLADSALPDESGSAAEMGTGAANPYPAPSQPVTTPTSLVHEDHVKLWVATSEMVEHYQHLQGRLCLLDDTQLDTPAVLNVSKKSMLTLLPGRWLNDEVMNKMLRLFLRDNMQLAATGKVPAVHIFDTYFMEKLYLGFGRELPEDRLKLTYSSVESQTLPKRLAVAGQHKSSILDCQLLVVPCHLPNHWVLVVADLHRQRIMYLDPFHGADPYGIMHALSRYLHLEAKNKKGLVLDPCSWPHDCVQDIPAQTDGHSCGLYALTFAQHLATGGTIEQLAASGISESTATAARAHITWLLTQGQDI